MKRNFWIAIAAAGLILSSCEKDKPETDRVNFENFTLGEEGVYNGSDLAGDFQIGNVIFTNKYNPDYASWSGFAVSNHTDTETRGYMNQYSSITGTGDDQSVQYAVLYTFSSDTLEFLVPEKVMNISFCNSTYVYYAILEGGDYSKTFGGDTGDEPDYFSLIIKGIDRNGEEVLDATLDLADYRYADNASDYISNVWTDIDLSDAGYLKYLVFSFESTDVGDWGINTPMYVCIDNIFGELQE